MGWLQPTLVLAAFLSSLLAGFLFAFAVVVMPGIKTLGDASYLRAFQVMDRVIQNNQPLFMLVWVGSAVTLVAAAVLGFSRPDSVVKVVLVAAVAVHFLGIQLPTATINIPLNNELQALDVSTLDDAALQAARDRFEPRWNRWNVIRTIAACSIALVLICLLLRR